MGGGGDVVREQAARWSGVVVLFLASWAAPSVAQAGAWTQPEGAFYAKIWSTVLVGSSYFAADGAIVESEPYQDVSLLHYAEYGLTDRWTLTTTGRPIGLSRYGSSEVQPYVGALTLGIRRGFGSGPLRFGLEAQAGYQGLVGEMNLAPAAAGFVYRPAVASASGRLEAQLGLGFSGGWAALNVGAVYFAADELQPALVAMAQVGYQPLESLSVDLHVPVNLLLGDIERPNITGTGETSYVGVGLGLSWWFAERVGLSATFDSAFFARANLATPALGLGVVLR